MRRMLFLPEAASTFATRVDGLHFFVIGMSMLVATGLAVVGLVFLVRYKRRPGDAPTTPRVEAPHWMEALFLSLPLTFFLLWFVIGFLDFSWFNSPPRGALDVYVMGKQWMWKFAYADGPSSVGVLYVPAGRPVRLLITSRDVIHSFFVPDFRVKHDAVPGRYTQIWFEAPRPGRHAIYCTEYCGLMHSRMRGEVVVLAPADFEAWSAQEQGGDVATLSPFHEGAEVEEARGPMAARGRRVAAEKGCFKCHTEDGTPHIGPTWLGLYLRVERLKSGEDIVADEAYLTRSMMDPDAQVVAGFLPVMPTYLGQLSATDAAALVEYIKSLRPARPGEAVSQEPVYVPTSR